MTTREGEQRWQRTIVTVAIVGLVCLSMLSAATIGSVGAASDDYISTVRVTDDVDEDDDGYKTAVELDVVADTDLDASWPRTTDPYFVVLVDGEEIATKEVEVGNRAYTIALAEEQLEALDRDRGEMTVRIELRNTQVGEDPLFDVSEAIIDYESSAEDTPLRTQSIKSISEFASLYRMHYERTLNIEYWRDVHQGSVENLAESTAPTADNGVDAAVEVLDGIAGTHGGTLLTTAEATIHLQASRRSWRVEQVLQQGNSNYDSEYDQFRRDLDAVEDNSREIQATEDEDRLEDLFQQRKALLESLYESLDRYERTIEAEVATQWYQEGPAADTLNPSGAWQAVFDLWAVDEEDYRLVEGQFQHLRNMTTADYYVTQQYLSPEGPSYENLDVVAGGAEPDNPDPEIVDVSAPTEATAGEPFEVTVEATNRGTDARYQTIALAPEDDIESIEIVEEDSANLRYADVFDPGTTVGEAYGTYNTTLEQPLAELGGPWAGGETNRLTVRMVPATDGEFTFGVKSVAQRGGWHSDPHPSDGGEDSSVAIDQQQEAVYQHTIPVGGTAPLEVTSEPGEATVFVDGVEVGTTPLSTERAVDESFDVTIEKDGYRSAALNGVSAPATEHVVLEEEQADPNFEVEVTGTNAPVEAGNPLTVGVGVENTGDVEATQSVGVDVEALGSDEESVTLGGGESSDLTFSLPTGDGDAGNYIARARTADDSNETPVAVTAAEDEQSTSVAWATAPPATAEVGETIAIAVTGESSDTGQVVVENDTASGGPFGSEDVTPEWTGSEWELEIGNDIDAAPGNVVSLQVRLETGDGTDSTATQQIAVTSSEADSDDERSNDATGDDEKNPMDGSDASAENGSNGDGGSSEEGQNNENEAVNESGDNNDGSGMDDESDDDGVSDSVGDGPGLGFGGAIVSLCIVGYLLRVRLFNSASDERW